MKIYTKTIYFFKICFSIYFREIEIDHAPWHICIKTAYHKVSDVKKPAHISPKRVMTNE